MKRILFARELKKVLLNRLPQDSSYVWSRKIEGLMVRSENDVTFADVALIIDTALTPEEFEMLRHEVYLTLYREEKLRDSKYSFIVCSKDAVDNSRVQKQHWVYLKSINRELKEYPYVCDNNPSLDNVLNECKKCFNFGQVIVFTTEAKVKALETYPANVRKNSVIVYAAKTNTMGKENIAQVCALGLEQDQESV